MLNSMTFITKRQEEPSTTSDLCDVNFFQIHFATIETMMMEWFFNRHLIGADKTTYRDK